MAINNSRLESNIYRRDGSYIDPEYNGAELNLKMLGGRWGDNVAQLLTQVGIAKALDGESEEARM